MRLIYVFEDVYLIADFLVTCHKKIPGTEQIWHEECYINIKICLCCKYAMFKMHFKSFFASYIVFFESGVTKKSFLVTK